MDCFIRQYASEDFVKFQGNNTDNEEKKTTTMAFGICLLRLFNQSAHVIQASGSGGGGGGVF